MRPRKDWMARLCAEARRRWKLDEQWRIEWKFVPKVEFSGSPCDIGVVVTYTEKHVIVHIAKAYFEKDRRVLRLDFIHEVGHALTQGIYRMVTDFIDQYDIMRPGSKIRAAFDERFNSEENVLLDHIEYQIMGLKK